MSGKIIPLRRSSPGIDALSEEALIAAYATGDRAAVAALFEMFGESVYRFLSRYIGADSPDLDDLVQATFLEVMRAAAKFRGGAAVQTWIFGIAINVARHHRRSEMRRSRLLHNFPAHPQVMPDGPEDRAAHTEKVSRLAVAVTELPENLRAPFVMCDLEGKPGPEVARVLQIPEGTLWRRLHEARKSLRNTLEAVQR